MTYQLLGGAAIVVGLIGTWLAARSRSGCSSGLASPSTTKLTRICW